MLKTMISTSLFFLSVPVLAASSGEGTFYDYSAGGGNCAFPKPDDIETAAMNKIDYQNSGACGGVIEVTNQDTGLSVIVRIDDQCPECAEGDVDMTREAFEQIAEAVTGRIPITWHYIANPTTENVKLVFKEGSTQYWAGVQVRDHRYPIVELAYRLTGSGQDFKTLTRREYNYFEQSDFGVGPYDFQITDACGQTLDIEAISMVVQQEIDAGIQFPEYTGNDCDIHSGVKGESENENENISAASSNGGALSPLVVSSLLLFRQIRRSYS